MVFDHKLGAFRGFAFLATGLRALSAAGHVQPRSLGAAAAIANIVQRGGFGIPSGFRSPFQIKAQCCSHCVAFR